MREFALAIYLFLSISGLSAQQSIVTSGGNVSSEEGTLSYSIGQLTSQTQRAITTTVSEGIQQAFEVSEIMSMDMDSMVTSLSVYPNPTTERLIISSDNNSRDLSYRLYDLQGIIYRRNELTANKSHVDMSQLEPAVYILEIHDREQKIKAFKIIKY